MVEISTDRTNNVNVNTNLQQVIVEYNEVQSFNFNLNHNDLLAKQGGVTGEFAQE
jgi:hypothetical protein